MTKEELIRNLKYTMEKHKNDKVDTFATDIYQMCKDTLSVLEAEPREDVLCHTNLKENAELIAKILDADVRGEIFLDKIRAEIEMEKLEDSSNFCIKAHNDAIDGVLQIIDKYKESEGKE